MKKTIKNIFKFISYGIFKILYGKIKGKVNTNSEILEIKNISFEKQISYRIFIAKDSRIYTDTINDTAIIYNNRIVDGASFQFRENINVDSEQNAVFKNGTPRIKKQVRGTVLSLLTGGGGNSNYWHWLFDVLPRIEIAAKKVRLDTIDYFLFPDLKENFQIETIKNLKIPLNKSLSSRIFRHFSSDKIICTDHPYNFLNDPNKDVLNIPKWIINFLKENFLKDNLNSKINLPKKFYIDRSDAKSGHKNMRTILNEHEVKNFLRKKGFSIVILSELHFNDQVKLFNNAEYIAGLHGAGFSNVVFCKPQTKIVEFQSDTAGEMFENLSKANNLNYESISVKPKTILENNQLGDIEIPMKTLEKVFN